MTFVEKEAGSSKTQPALKSAIGKACGALPLEFKLLAPVCKALVSAAAEQIIKLIISKQPPNKICQEVKFC